ncbi:unnamed protein product [Caenorhabditis auriculariae]|uniref:Uncharacterized protein n=1 Tax=Caenorhabditis auriculariae TaxID=2777116 RepID=A0A8S1HEP1_9PELO|nr:unnamed protein product [Caenorhabditis auriculariae]
MGGSTGIRWGGGRDGQSCFSDELGEKKKALLDRTFSEPRATYQRLGLGLHCTLEPEAKASDSGSTASLWSLRPRPGAESPIDNGSTEKNRPAAAPTLPDKTKASGSMLTFGVRRRPASIPSHRST